MNKNNLNINKPISSQKEKLMSKASVLFWNKGYQGTTMRDIANAYGCKPANIYNFFPNKEAILYEILLEQMQDLILLLKPLEEDNSLSPVEKLRNLVNIHLTFTLRYTKSFKILFDVGLDYLSPSKKRNIVSLRDEYDRILWKILINGLESGDFEKTNLKIAIHIIASMIVRTIIWYSPEGRLSIEEIAELLFKFALYGLKGPKRR